jgi:hypothetical protein
MMKNFMTSGSLTQDKEPKVDAVMMVYDGRPPPRKHRMSILCLRTPPHCG